MMKITNDPNNIIYYTDTDSVHCKPIVGFKEGKNLGEFHNDIDAPGKPILHTNVISAGYFISKKFYNHIVFYEDNNGLLQVTVHNVIKGISSSSMVDPNGNKVYSNKALNELSASESLSLFEDFFEGKTVSFDLLNNDKVSMIRTKTGVSNREKLIRNIKCTN